MQTPGLNNVSVHSSLTSRCYTSCGLKCQAPYVQKLKSNLKNWDLRLLSLPPNWVPSVTTEIKPCIIHLNCSALITSVIFPGRLLHTYVHLNAGQPNDPCLTNSTDLPTRCFLDQDGGPRRVPLSRSPKRTGPPHTLNTNRCLQKEKIMEFINMPPHRKTVYPNPMNAAS